ncbi:MAG: hypothetical protein UZ07_CHB004002161 [Chlorobi bacterium OLB7]|nr:MAG: hypothetical protein UZ07_CHB004002161 [Chlorobi bacterium OLB7]
MPILNCLHSRTQFFFWPAVAGLARFIQVQQWTTDVMVADLHCPFPFVWHVAIGTGNAGAGMNPLIIQFELRMLRF